MQRDLVERAMAGGRGGRYRRQPPAHRSRAGRSPQPTPLPSALPEPTRASLFAGFDEEVVQLSPESGQGIRPLLEWEAVDGADHYALFLFAPDGAAYWAWMGPQTSVHVGGEPQLREGAPGPSIIDGMSWLVFAYDEGGLPIAMSPVRPISP